MLRHLFPVLRDTVQTVIQQRQEHMRGSQLQSLLPVGIQAQGFFPARYSPAQSANEQPAFRVHVPAPFHQNFRQTILLTTPV